MTSQQQTLWNPAVPQVKAWEPPGGWDPRWSPSDRWFACGLRISALMDGYSEADASTLAHIGVSLRILDDVRFSDAWMEKWRLFEERLIARTAPNPSGTS